MDELENWDVKLADALYDFRQIGNDGPFDMFGVVVSVFAILSLLGAVIFTFIPDQHEPQVLLGLIIFTASIFAVGYLSSGRERKRFAAYAASKGIDSSEAIKFIDRFGCDDEFWDLQLARRSVQGQKNHAQH